MQLSSIIASLQDSYGPEVTSADIRGWCAMNDCNYQSITRRLEKEGPSIGGSPVKRQGRLHNLPGGLARLLLLPRLVRHVPAGACGP